MPDICVVTGRLRWIEASDHDALDDCAWFQFGPERLRKTPPAFVPKTKAVIAAREGGPYRTAA